MKLNKFRFCSKVKIPFLWKSVKCNECWYRAKNGEKKKRCMMWCHFKCFQLCINNQKNLKAHRCVQVWGLENPFSTKDGALQTFWNCCTRPGWEIGFNHNNCLILESESFLWAWHDDWTQEKQLARPALPVRNKIFTTKVANQVSRDTHYAHWLTWSLFFFKNHSCFWTLHYSQHDGAVRNNAKPTCHSHRSTQCRHVWMQIE